MLTHIFSHADLPCVATPARLPLNSIDAIPKTASGKILRREMREMAKKLPSEAFQEKRKVVAKL